MPFRVDTGVIVPPNGPFASNFTGSARYDSGFNAGARLGGQFGPWRLEEEYSYRHNGLSSFAAFFGPGLNSAFTGQRITHSLMTNFIYDFGSAFLFSWPISPHIGFGIGAVDNVDSISLNPVTLAGLPRTTVSTPGGIAGVIGATSPFPNPTLGGTFLKGSSGVSAIRRSPVSATTSTRCSPLTSIIATSRPPSRPSTTKGVAPFPPFGFPPSTMKYKSGYNTQNIVASLTMKFGAPPPAPPPPAPPAPPPPPTHQVYLVFFDWDKYNITPEGQQIIQLAANQYRSGGRVTLQVTGYTDTSGSPGYNQRLSERRANAVAAALERLGVPRSDMVVAGRGRTTCAFRRRTACASRRTAASRSSSRKEALLACKFRGPAGTPGNAAADHPRRFSL